MPKKPKIDPYQAVTDKVLELIEQGVAPWRRPWTGGGIATSLATGKEYGGINALVLPLAGYASRYWLTFQNCRKLRGAVKKGEKSTYAYFFKWWVKEERNPDTGEVEKKRIPMLRVHPLFNVEQCEGLEDAKLPEGAFAEPTEKPWDPHVKSEELLTEAVSENRIPTLNFDGGGRAFYRPSTDSVHLPKKESFESPDGYYSTAFHESAHATGHSSRLDRKLDTKPAGFGAASYSREELVAELAAAFLCGFSGVDNSGDQLEQSASYIKGWASKLKKDKKLIVTAAAQAQKAANWVRGLHFHQTKGDA